jgi:signal transduction histidine kinase
MKVTYSKTRRKIALAFTVLASFLIVLTTITTVLLVNITMDRQARSSLETSLQTVISDYTTNAVADKEVKFQVSNRASASSYDNLPNINQQKGEIDLTKVEALKSAYSRVVKANGDIAITSDLFETYAIKDLTTGFRKLYFGDNCIYLLAVKTASGDTIQTAQYCPLTNAQQLNLFGLMAVIGIVTSILTYLLGLVMANLFLRPLQKSTQATKDFIQNVYHELHTPITVAITTAEAAKLSKDYAQGIDSVSEDLTTMRDTLITLHDALNHDLNQHQQTDIAEVIKAIAQEFQITIPTNHKVIKNVSVDAARIIFRNLIENSVKYSNKEIVVELNAKQFRITNNLDNPQAIDLQQLFTRGYRGQNTQSQPGHGLGLAIVKELATQIGWQVSARISNNQLIITLKF